MSSILVLCIILFHQGIQNSFAWGPIGHALVARLAQSQLDSSVNSWINNYIPSDLSGNLSAIASWPDLILYPDTNPLDYMNWQWSRPLHFIDIPDWKCEYEPTRDCVKNVCVEGALKNYSQRLIDNKCDYIQQQQALFFLVHFVGDSHQPLHSGFKGDFGGNAVKGFFLNDKNLTNLHTIWDVEIIDYRIARHFQSDVNLYFEYLKTLMLNESSAMNESYNDYKKWIDESVNYVCQQIYLDDNNTRIDASTHFRLGEIYFNRNWPLVDQRLTQGGYRLSVLFNQLYKNRSTTKLPPDMLALIIGSCIALVIVLVLSECVYLYKRKTNQNQHALLTEEA